jgi:DNA-binding response OmpR family regulator
VTLKGSVTRFTAREVEVLEILMRWEGQVASKSSIENALYGLSSEVSQNSVEVIISRIRRRMDPIAADCVIHTLHGIGYLLKKNTHTDGKIKVAPAPRKRDSHNPVGSKK